MIPETPLVTGEAPASGATPAQPIERQEPPAIALDAPDGPDSAAAPAFWGAAMNPRRPVCDPGRLGLALDRMGLLDDALAPLVAAGLVHHEIARVVESTLRVGLLETCGPESAACRLVRTLKAIELASAEANQIGGA